ncbi:MAG: hypothetical protein O2794_01585 [bacterium]|nr:hypothetical protein [bacterium]
MNRNHSKVVLPTPVNNLVASTSSQEVFQKEVSGFFSFSANVDGVLQEAGLPKNSSSPYWWLNSGAFLVIERGVFRTIQGPLEDNSSWRKLYLSNDPDDTDEGRYPQNLFRLVTHDTWKTFIQSFDFSITKDNLSQSTNRAESNGILSFNRYQDGDNLYYAGIRVDGAAVIKKKIGGEYYTLDYQPYFEGEYNRDTHPNLLPHKQWLGLKSVVQTQEDNTVLIQLYLDEYNKGDWKLVAEAIDDGSQAGAPFLKEGHAGIRTDFMDVEFDNYLIREIE